METLKDIGKLLQNSQNNVLVQLNVVRNETMATNIDAILTACEKVGPKAKAFFAVGAGHILVLGGEIKVIPEHLSERGWSLEFVEQ